MEYNVEDELIRGDSAVIEFELTDDENKIIPLENIDTLILTARTYPDSEELFSKDTGDFLFENDIYSVEILPEDTQELNITKFYFDIEITLTDGTRRTILGKLDLEKDITTHKSGGVDNEN